MAQAPDPIELLQQRQATNRQQYADRVTQQSSLTDRTQPEMTYGGRDADQGTYLLESPNGGTLNAGPTNTNGLILPGRRVGVRGAGSTVEIEGKPSPKPSPVTPPPARDNGGKVKVLFLVESNGEQTYYLGGDRRQPEAIFTKPAGVTSVSILLNNYGVGRNKWQADINYILNGNTIIKTVGQTNYFYSTADLGGFGGRGWGFFSGGTDLVRNQVSSFFNGQLQFFPAPPVSFPALPQGPIVQMPPGDINNWIPISINKDASLSLFLTETPVSQYFLLHSSLDTWQIAYNPIFLNQLRNCWIDQTFYRVNYVGVGDSILENDRRLPITQYSLDPGAGTISEVGTTEEKVFSLRSPQAIVIALQYHP